MKVLQNNNKTETKKHRHIYTNRNSQAKFKKRTNDFRFTRRSTTKYGNYLIRFIEETMQKLKTFGEKFKVKLDSNLTQLKQQNIY